MSISSPAISNRTQRRVALMRHNSAVNQQKALVMNRAMAAMTVASVQAVGGVMLAFYLIKAAFSTL